MQPPAAQAASSAALDIASLTFFPTPRACAAAALLAALMVFHGASVRADDQPDDDEGADAVMPAHLVRFYRRVALPPYLERGVQAILQAEWEAAQASAEKVGLRRMSRSRYRRTLVALDRATDAKIRALIGARRFLTWNRARMDPLFNSPGCAAPASCMQRSAGRATPARPPRTWTRDRCAGLRRLLRGPALGDAAVEEAHFWIHDHARHC
jgi:hypothetical protein